MSVAASKVLLIAPRFTAHSFWSWSHACEATGVGYPTAPLGLITVAALLPKSWSVRLIDRNIEESTTADLDWVDMVMNGGMLPQQLEMLELIRICRARGKPIVVGGADPTSSPHIYEEADFRVLGEAEDIIEQFIAAWNAGARSGVFEAEKFQVDVTRSPIPRFDLLKRHRYFYIGLQFSRGCPFNCEFCDIIELFGRVPRAKSNEQMLNELETLYRLGYRGHVDFVDDNLVGNKKALRKFLPDLIQWQRAHNYPFLLSTEASINLADDQPLLGLMRDANFFAMFVGIESPDTDTLVSMQKKQNTRRSLAESIQRIYRAGILVAGGFIVGFDSERGSVADGIVDCIEDVPLPICMLNLLYALPNTQLTRRLQREGRLHAGHDRAPPYETIQTTTGLNFDTPRARPDVLVDFRTILEKVYHPAAYLSRVRRTIPLSACASGKPPLPLDD